MFTLMRHNESKFVDDESPEITIKYNIFLDQINSFI